MIDEGWQLIVLWQGSYLSLATYHSVLLRYLRCREHIFHDAVRIEAL